MPDDEPCLMEIEDAFPLRSEPDSVIVYGRIVRGTPIVDSRLELVCFAPKPGLVTLVAVNVSEYASSYLIQGVAPSAVWRGQVLATPSTVKPATMFVADVLFDERSEKIKQQPLNGICRFNFFIRHAGIFGTLYLPRDKRAIVHRDHFTAEIELNEPCGLEIGLWFGIGRLLGQGRVTEVIC